jgi:hypothetical protein
MGTITTALYRAGEYSFMLVLPKSWLKDVNFPRLVRVQVGRKRLVIYPCDGATEEKYATKKWAS